MDHRAKEIARIVGKVVFHVLRFTLFVVLLVVGRLVQPIAAFASGAGILAFLFFIVVRPDLKGPMLGSAAVAIGSCIVSVSYHWLLQVLAPAGTVVVSEV